MRKLLFVMGTRPEAIKLAPVVLEAQRTPGSQARICATAQHRELLDQVLQVFGLRPNFDLDLMRPGQSLHDLTSRLFSALPGILEQAQPDAVIVQGDTTTAFAAATAAFYQRIPVAHVEAGLRSGNLAAPFPEEGNRKLISAIATWHFAPTQHAFDQLLAEQIPSERVWLTGNTVVDALQLILARLPSPNIDPLDRRMILVTGHRRESFGRGMQDFSEALRQIASKHPDVRIVYPVHPNPNVLEPVKSALSSCANVELIAPVDYLEFLRLLQQCTFVITDSGGVQEEAPVLGKPVLVTREVTERIEAVNAGSARLVGTDTKKIVDAAEELLTDAAVYDRMSRVQNPFGDGHAAERIVKVLAGQ
ncbi:MAG: non-hydrolyzing UDP-N-acetylglucosamine 2-epimerase [Candidatus Sumerlaeaceae bacterium]